MSGLPDDYNCPESPFLHSVPYPETKKKELKCENTAARNMPRIDNHLTTLNNLGISFQDPNIQST